MRTRHLVLASSILALALPACDIVEVVEEPANPPAAVEAEMTPADVAALEALADCRVIASKLGSAWASSLTEADCVGSIRYVGAPQNASIDYYGFRLEGDGTTRVNITMRSTAADSYVALYRKNGTLIVTDDDTGGGTDAEILSQSLSAGVYLIAASGNGGVDEGNYELRINRVPR